MVILCVKFDSTWLQVWAQPAWVLAAGVRDQSDVSLQSVAGGGGLPRPVWCCRQVRLAWPFLLGFIWFYTWSNTNYVVSQWSIYQTSVRYVTSTNFDSIHLKLYICVTVWDVGSNWRNDVPQKNDVNIMHQVMWYLRRISQIYKSC